MSDGLFAEHAMSQWPEDARLRGWAIVLTMVIVVTALAALMWWFSQDPDAVVSIIDLEFAGTGETAWTLLQMAHRQPLLESLAWDLPLIATYSTGLYFGLKTLALVVRARELRAVFGEPIDAGPYLTLLDRVTPRFAITAGVCDLAQDAAILVLLTAPTANAPLWLEFDAAFITLMTLANWTLVVVAAGHLLWLVWRSIAPLPRRDGGVLTPGQRQELFLGGNEGARPVPEVDQDLREREP